jgi:hypothetical protein
MGRYAQLSEQLNILKAELRQRASDHEHDKAIVAIGEAAQAASAGDQPTTLKYLKAAGGWALDAATTIGTAVAAKAIEVALQL